MSYYSLPQVELLYKLINESNPGLLELRDVVNSRIGVPFDRTPGPGEIQDTSIELYATENSFYQGKMIVHYRRINLTNLFKNMRVYLDNWHESGYLQKSQIVQEMNRRFELTLTDGDLSGTQYTGGNRNISVTATSIAYKGYFPINWTIGKRDLPTILTKDRYAGLYWDRLYTPGKPLMTPVGFGLDFSRFRGTTSLTTGSSIGSGMAGYSDFKVMLDWFYEVTGIRLDPLKYYTNAPDDKGIGIGGLTLARFTIPHTNLPEANVHKFNRALVITSNAYTYFCGRILFHYNG